MHHPSSSRPSQLLLSSLSPRTIPSLSLSRGSRYALKRSLLLHRRLPASGLSLSMSMSPLRFFARAPRYWLLRCRSSRPPLPSRIRVSVASSWSSKTLPLRLVELRQIRLCQSLSPVLRPHSSRTMYGASARRSFALTDWAASLWVRNEGPVSEPALIQVSPSFLAPVAHRVQFQVEQIHNRTLPRQANSQIVFSRSYFAKLNSAT
jgi:hypothetical protein